ncbi:MAG: HAMP domain-containing histidine kinase [Dorea sp.]|jgi:signal transduction histidine kinase|nr:HAMP domain-containing histidine kinase [Dorea sp.]
MKAYKYVLLTVHIFLMGAGGVFLWGRVSESRTRIVLFMFFILFSMLDAGYYLYFRRRFIIFTEEICRKAGRIMANERDGENQNKETLTSKLVMELEKMEEITQNRFSESEQEKEKLQKTVSEIAHQIKTPLSNIRMYQDMLAESDIPEEEAEEFRGIIGQQLEKLEFLIDSLIKASRLESDLIRLNIENHRIFRTLEISVNGVIKKADRKKIDVSIHCDPAVRAFHDVKWTAEAIGNVLDNAVKYTPERGHVRISVVSGELYVEIRVEDTGTGIEPDHYNDIFQRFYRGASVLGAKGLGLGLYIAKNIVMREGGYMMVHSVLGEGSAFSVFLPKNHCFGFDNI